MKKKIIILLCFLLGLSWYTAIYEAVSNPKKVAAHIEAAEELEAKGIYVDAISEYEQALAYEPENVDISLKMADAYLATGNSKKFQTICKECAENNQKDTKALDHLMDYYIALDNQVKAVKYLNDFIAIYPKNENANKWMLELKGSYTYLFCNYDELSEITNNTMVVKKDELYGLADGKGTEMIAAVYEELYPFSEEGFALAKLDNSYIYIDTNGQRRLIAENIDPTRAMIANNRAIVYMNGKYGYRDEKLEPVTECEWDALSLIEEGIGAGEKNGKWALLDKNGEEKSEYIYDDVICDNHGFCSKRQRIFVKEQKYYHMIDKKGKAIGDLKLEMAYPFAEGAYAAVCIDGKWGFADTEGNLVIECIYDDARSFSYGFAAVCIEEQWGYIDENGHMVIEPQFQSVTAISKEGTAAVLAEEWELIQLSVFL